MSNSNDDFGFSFEKPTDHKDFQANVELETKKNVKDKVELFYLRMIEPFLDNLMKNPSDEYIRWPNRVAKIQDYKLKIAKYIKDLGV